MGRDENGFIWHEFGNISCQIRLLQYGSLKFIQLLGEPIDVNRSPIKDYVLPTLVLLTFREQSCILTLGEVNLYFPNSWINFKPQNINSLIVLGGVMTYSIYNFLRNTKEKTKALDQMASYIYHNTDMKVYLFLTLENYAEFEAIQEHHHGRIVWVVNAAGTGPFWGSGPLFV